VAEAQEQLGNSLKKAAPANLLEHSFKPGQSGNPGGRPKGRSITAALNEYLDEIAPDDIPRKLGLTDRIGVMTWREAIAVTTVRAAVSGDSAARRDVLSYTEGAPRQSVDMTHSDQERPSLEEIFAEIDELRTKAFSDADGS
jgi:hypothetical protein